MSRGQLRYVLRCQPGPSALGDGAVRAGDPVARRMRKQRERDTAPERSLRGELHRQGLRYRIHVRPLQHLRREADVVFTRARVAVFVHGCFWHGCPDHATWPRTNEEFWRRKIERNRTRDKETEAELSAKDWLCVTVWEHETPVEAASRVIELVRSRLGAF
jgi:DNA mismatch endonuclease, patch repair protein